MLHKTNIPVCLLHLLQVCQHCVKTVWVLFLCRQAVCFVFIAYVEAKIDAENVMAMLSIIWIKLINLVLVKGIKTFYIETFK